MLDGVDLSIQGGLTAVLGPNGAGKSTLLRCIATVLSPDSGSMLIDGLDPRFESDRIEIRRRLGYLPQAHGLGGSTRVFDTLDYLAVLKECGDERTRRHMVFDALERVGLADRAAAPIAELSGGMRQRLGVAQALLAAPTLLILDEPAAGLDPDERFRLREVVAERRQRSTVILSTHLTDEVTHCDTVIVLDHGRVRFVGTPTRLAEQAAGRAWRQSTRPDEARASWLEADGTYRCLGTPPPGAVLVPPTVEDGYLLLVDATT
ncbi:MAG: ATP-binding cassette domain-containing protein [Acidimicrobiales bacterium]